MYKAYRTLPLPRQTATDIACLSLPLILKETMLPAASVLMDTCHLTNLEVQYALSPITQLIAYQILAAAQESQPNTHVNTLDGLFELPIVQAFTQTSWQQGFNFTVIHHIQPTIAPLNQAFFLDNLQYQRILGALMAITQLPENKVALLLAWCVAISCKVLWDINRLLSANTVKQAVQLQPAFKHWLAWQPTLFAAREVNSHFSALAWVAGYQDTISRQARQAELKDWQRYPSATQQHFAQLIQAYIASRPLAIVPQKINKTLMPATNSVTDPSLPPQTTDIFAVAQPRPKSQWVDNLQKYWIATAAGLSAVVFAGVGLITHPKQHSLFDKKSQTLVASTPQYHDVAIIKVASEPQSSASATASLVAKPNDKTAKMPSGVNTTSSQPLAKNATNKTHNNKKNLDKTPPTTHNDNKAKKTITQDKGKNTQSVKADLVKDRTTADKKLTDKKSDRKNDKSLEKNADHNNDPKTIDKKSDKSTDKKATHKKSADRDKLKN